ncbi:MAG: zinc-finger domain-containing protein [Methylophilaceae bacterium]
MPIFCPPKNSNSWSMHPKIFLDLNKNYEVACPYCGKLYRLKN